MDKERAFQELKMAIGRLQALRRMDAYDPKGLHETLGSIVINIEDAMDAIDRPRTMSMAARGELSPVV